MSPACPPSWRCPGFGPAPHPTSPGCRLGRLAEVRGGICVLRGLCPAARALRVTPSSPCEYVPRGEMSRGLRSHTGPGFQAWK